MLGKIQLINDDCLKVLNTLNSFDLIITDPPYFVLPTGKPNDNFEWDNFEDLTSFLDFTETWFDSCFNILNNDSFMYIFWSQKYLNEGIKLFQPDRILIWRHDNLTFINSGDYIYDYEPIFLIKKGNPKLSKGKYSSILNYSKPQSNFNFDKLIHPTQKPLSLIEHIVEISSNENDNILDPFMGSGTTGLACKRLNRNFTGIEKNKTYFEMASNRINEIIPIIKGGLF